VIGYFHPLSTVAPYALALKLQALIAAPSIAIAGIVAPRVAGAGMAGLALYRRRICFLAVLNVGAVSVLSVLSSEAFGAISHEYRGEHLLLVAMAPFLLLSALAPLPSITLNQIGHAGSRLRVAGITVAIDLGLDLLLVPWLDAYGAAIATTLAFGYYFVRHDLLVEEALVEQRAGAPSIRRDLAQGAVAVVVACALAWAIKLAIGAIVDAPSDLLVLLAAALPVAALHTAWASRIVRR
jgi:O-antigen/teichoic acid export membrane protein